MAFTYSDSLAANRDKVRFHLGDTVSGKGPRPDKRNFSDAEISFLLTEEASRVNGATAHGFETLASEWSSYALSEREGDVSFDASKVADDYRKQAAIWRNKPGGAAESESSGGLITLERVDAYTDD